VRGQTRREPMMSNSSARHRRACNGHRRRTAQAVRNEALPAATGDHLDVVALGWTGVRWEWAWSASLGRVVYGEDGAAMTDLWLAKSPFPFGGTPGPNQV
jgi:hypothetical protein